MKRFASIILCFAALLCAAADKPSSPAFKDLNGVAHHPLEPADKLASVLFFYWHDCPISNGMAPEMNRIRASYTNFAFYIVQVDRKLSASAAKKHAAEYDLRAPVLLDGKHRLVKLAGATVTPEAVVIGKDGNVLYRGRIDDLYVTIGKKRAAATQHDLRDALDAISAGQPVKQKETKAIGCLIEK